MQIVVIDGQGGGIGKNLVERLRAELPETQIVAVGANSIATSAMLDVYKRQHRQCGQSFRSRTERRLDGVYYFKQNADASSGDRLGSGCNRQSR